MLVTIPQSTFAKVVPGRVQGPSQVLHSKLCLCLSLATEAMYARLKGLEERKKALSSAETAMNKVAGRNGRE